MIVLAAIWSVLFVAAVVDEVRRPKDDPGNPCTCGSDPHGCTYPH